jgi:hypothetical protein
MFLGFKKVQGVVTGSLAHNVNIVVYINGRDTLSFTYDHRTLKIDFLSLSAMV